MDSQKKTFWFNIIRSSFTGIMDAGLMGISLLIAIRVFNAPESYKIWIAAGIPIGFMLTSLTVFGVSKSGMKAGTACMIISASIGLSFIGAACVDSLLPFCICIIFAKLLSAQASPLIVQIYSQNYTKNERGTNISFFLITVSLFSGISSYFFGLILDHDISWYRYIYLFIGFSSIGVIVSLSQIPSSKLKAAKNNNPLKNLSFYYKDKLFGWMLTMWMFMGIGNLMTMPQRVEYLANDKYGLALSNQDITTIVLVIPSIMSILSSQIWGRMFDKLHFIPIRLALNLLLLIGLVLFFNSHTFLWLSIATGITGLAMGGATITWNLWVTKLAPEGDESAYMSVHTTLNGMRGIVAPPLGYYALSQMNMSTFSYLAGSCILLSIFMLFFVFNHKRFA